MPRLKIKHPPADTEWTVESSRIMFAPERVAADTLPELRSRVSHLIRKGNEHREPKKRIKDLSFRYETDAEDYVTVVHVYFVGYTKRSIKAMRLVRHAP